MCSNTVRYSNFILAVRNVIAERDKCMNVVTVGKESRTVIIGKSRFERYFNITGISYVYTREYENISMLDFIFAILNSAGARTRALKVYVADP